MQFVTEFGTVTLTVEKHLTKQEPITCQGGHTVYQHIQVFGRPASVKLVVNVTTAEDVTPLVDSVDVANTELRPEGVILEVPVAWNNGMPRTRATGKDNVHVILVHKSGRMIELECAIVTRNHGQFYMEVQQIWKGWIVRTRGEGNKVVWVYIPTDSVHAYPGASYNKIWKGLAEAILVQAMDLNASTQKSRARKPAEWQPPTIDASVDADGYHQAVVLYYNVVSGTGRILDAEGKAWFVHFNNIASTDRVRTITPMTMVLFRHGQHKPGQSIPEVATVKQAA